MTAWAWVAIGASGIGLRQVDRLWFALRRGEGEPASVPAILNRQRSRANNITPALLILGHWLEVFAWWGLGVALGPAFLVVTVLMIAVKFRHLQETSHFATHGVLFRSLRTGDLLTDLTIHAPLGYVPVPDRRERHVRRHHPNAAVPGVDPNLDDLERAGIRPGASPARFVAGVLFPCTPRGFADTLRGIGRNLRTGAAAPWRAAIFLLVAWASFRVGGVPILIAGYLVPRLLVFPQLAWMSLLVEHTWFEPAPSNDDVSRIDLEAARCIRLYRRRMGAELIARGLWLPYGDLYHFAHSAHPSVRWNYLRRVDQLLGSPGRAPGHVVFGKDSVLAALHRVTVRSTSLQRLPEPARSRI